MAGKKGRSGRPKGSRNLSSAARCVQRLNFLIVSWLAAVPVSEIRIMLPMLEGCPELQALIEECWNERGDKRQRRPSLEIKQKLADIAIAAETKLQQQIEDGNPEVRETKVRLQAYWARTAEEKLKGMGKTEEEIGAHYNKLFGRRKPKKPFEAPSVDAVLKLWRRKASERTLRRKSEMRQLKSQL